VAYTYRDLIGWQKAMALASAVYRESRSFPPHELYGLTSQLRRSAVSIPSNIAEGQGRLSKSEFLRFLGFARGSLYELETQILVAADLSYIRSETAERLLAISAEVNRILNGLMSSLT
jgi:four helix bundle protein